MEGNQQHLNQSFKDRKLLNTLKQLILDLLEIEEDVAKLDVSNVGTCVGNVKRVLLKHGKNINDFKHVIDNIRKEILKERNINKVSYYIKH